MVSTPVRCRLCGVACVGGAAQACFDCAAQAVRNWVASGKPGGTHTATKKKPVVETISPELAFGSIKPKIGKARRK